MIEEWKPLLMPGYEGFYEVSTLGNFRSLDRIVETVHNSKRVMKGKPLQPRPDSLNRYLLVDLTNAHKVRKTSLAHRIIGIAFLGLSDGMEINHENGNTKDNRVVNLKVLTRSDNEKHKYRVLNVKHPTTGKFGKLHHRSKPVLQIEPNTLSVVQEFESNRIAEKDGFTSSAISLCCNGKQIIHKGFMWRFK